MFIYPIYYLILFWRFFLPLSHFPFNINLSYGLDKFFEYVFLLFFIIICK